MDYKLACEYRAVALRVEHLVTSGKTREDTELLLDMLEAVAEPVMVIVQHRPFSPDANDDMVLEVAINGKRTQSSATIQNIFENLRSVFSWTC